LIHLYEGFGSVIYFLTVDKQLTEFSSWWHQPNPVPAHTKRHYTSCWFSPLGCNPLFSLCSTYCITISAAFGISVKWIPLRMIIPWSISSELLMCVLESGLTWWFLTFKAQARWWLWISYLSKFQFKWYQDKWMQFWSFQ
jgi:hypothetical protein